MVTREFIIEDNVPLPEERLKKPFKKKDRYEAFDNLDVGQSFVVHGSKADLQRLSVLVRVRNHRSKGERKFFWDYDNPEKTAIRVWRVE